MEKLRLRDSLVVGCPCAVRCEAEESGRSHAAPSPSLGIALCKQKVKGFATAKADHLDSNSVEHSTDTTLFTVP